MVHWKFRGGRLGEGPKGQNLQGRLEFLEGVPGDSNQQHFVRENGYFLEPKINFRGKVASKLQVLFLPVGLQKCFSFCNRMKNEY